MDDENRTGCEGRVVPLRRERKRERLREREEDAGWVDGRGAERWLRPATSICGTRSQQQAAIARAGQATPRESGGSDERERWQKRAEGRGCACARSRPNGHTKAKECVLPDRRTRSKSKAEERTRGSAGISSPCRRGAWWRLHHSRVCGRTLQRGSRAQRRAPLPVARAHSKAPHCSGARTALAPRPPRRSRPLPLR